MPGQRKYAHTIQIHFLDCDITPIHKRLGRIHHSLLQNVQKSVSIQAESMDNISVTFILNRNVFRGHNRSCELKDEVK